MANEFIVRKGLIVEGASGGTVVDVQGSQGQLFSVTDDLSGSIFAVSDISGVPIFDINSSGVSYFDGNVGIGTTAPTKKLDVVSNTTYDGIQISGSAIPTLGIIDTTNNAKFVAYVRDSDATIGMETNHPLTINTNNTERMRIGSGGNVGIGITAPTTKLHVVGQDITFYSGTAEQSLQVGRNANERTEIFINDLQNKITAINDADNNDPHKFILNRAFLGTGANTFEIQKDGSVQLLIDTSGNVGIGTTSPSAKLQITGSDGYLKFDSNGDNGFIKSDFNLDLYADDTANNSSGYSNIRFFTYGANEKMRITSGGNVGIGTTSPDTTLHVQGATDPRIDLGEDPNNKVWMRWNSSGNYADFTTRVGGTYHANTLVLKDGNIGIKITAPTQRLHVSGNARVTGAYYDSNNSPGTAGQVLSSTVTGTDWVAAGSGSTVYTAAIWEVDSDIFTADNTTIVCDTNRIYNGTTSVSTAGPTTGSLVMDVAGVYEISYSVAVRVPQSGAPSTRQVPALYLTLTPDGGTEAKIPGSLNSTYLRLYGSNQGGFTSFSNKIYVETDENGEVQLKIVWLDGTDKDVEIYSAAGIQNTISIRRIT